MLVWGAESANSMKKQQQLNKQNRFVNNEVLQFNFPCPESVMVKNKKGRKLFFL